MVIGMCFGFIAGARAQDANIHDGQKCGWLDSVRTGPYLVQNDVWGPVQNTQKAGYPANYVQCIDGYTFESGRASAAFHWAIRSSNDVVSYPHIQFDFDAEGGKPGPIAIGDLRHRPDISAFSSYALHASAAYNVSYDIWLTAAAGQSTQRVIELMIWLDTDMRQNTPATGSVTVDGNRYDIYRKSQGGPGKEWEYIALVADHPINNARISLSRISLELADRGVLNTADTITSVQFGAEITGGTGTLAIHDFDLTNGF